MTKPSRNNPPGYSHPARHSTQFLKNEARAIYSKDARFPKRFRFKDESGTPCPTPEEIAAGMRAIRDAYEECRWKGSPLLQGSDDEDETEEAGG